MSKHPVSAVLAQVDYLHLWLDAIDAGPHPMDPTRLSAAARAFIVSGVVRNLARVAPDERHAHELHAAAHQMASNAMGGMLAGWEEGDDLCPRYPHWPIPHWGFKPQPEPWRDGAHGWVDRLSAAALGPLIDGAAASLQQRVAEG